MRTKDEPRAKARERAMELSFRCENVRKVSRLLEDEGLGGLLAQSELESIMIEAKAIQEPCRLTILQISEHEGSELFDRASVAGRAN